MLKYALPLLIFMPFALAQNADVTYNLPSWGQSIISFAFALTLLTQAIKVRLKNRLDTLPHYVPQALTVALGIVIAGLINQRGLLTDPVFALVPSPWGWLLFGTVAGVGSIGGYDFVMAVAGTLGGGKTVLLPTIEQAEAQVSAVPKLAVDGLRNLASSFGLPGFVVTTLLNEHTFAEAERIIRQMGKERALTEGEISDSLDDFEKQNPVVRNPATPNPVVKKVQK